MKASVQQVLSAVRDEYNGRFKKLEREDERIITDALEDVERREACYSLKRGEVQNG
jgi:hypothetical protein